MLFNNAYAPNPRLSDKQVKPFSRVFLWITILVYVFYGFFNRDPWKNEDVIGFTSIYKLIDTPFFEWNKTISLLSWGKTGSLYYLFSAITAKFFIFLSVRVDHAVRIGATLLLLGSIFLIWKSVFKLCFYKNFVPYEYPLGGQPSKYKYAKCMADIGALLFCSCIGAILRIHETTPFILGIFLTSLLCYTIIYQGRLLVMLFLNALCLLISLYFNHSILAVFMYFILLFNGLDYVLFRFKYINDNINSKYFFLIKIVISILPILISFFYFNLIGSINYKSIITRLNILLIQYPTFTWPILPFAFYAFLYWRNESVVQKLMILNFISIFIFIFDTKLHQGYFLYAIPVLCILASLAFAKISITMHKAIIGFNIILFSLLLCALWIIWINWQDNIHVIKYLYHVNHDISITAVIFAGIASLVWLSMLFIYRKILLNPPIWLSSYLMASGLTISWVVIVHLWLPAVNQIKTYRYVFNTINLYVKDSCVKSHNLQAPQMASLYYMAKFKIGNNCKFILSYMPYTKNLSDIDIVPPDNSILVWQGRRLLDKDESFYLWQSLEYKNNMPL